MIITEEEYKKLEELDDIYFKETQDINDYNYKLYDKNIFEGYKDHPPFFSTSFIIKVEVIRSEWLLGNRIIETRFSWDIENMKNNPLTVHWMRDKGFIFPDEVELLLL